MSVTSESIAYRGYPGPFIPIEALGLREIGDAPATSIESALTEKKIATVALTVGQDDFAQFSGSFDVCVEDPDVAELLAQTYHLVDSRYGHTAGYFRKERKFNESGLQIEDPKHVFQFNEQARTHWESQLADAPQVLKDFLERGYDIHNQLLQAGRVALSDIDISYPGILEEHFPKKRSSVSFMRIVRYDGYENTPENNALPVAKPHVDIASYTIQAWSTAPGFWGRNEDGKVFYDDQGNDGFFFASKTHEKLFGKHARIRPLVHGVDRINPGPEVATVPERTAVVLFINPTRIDPKVTPAETRATY